VPTWLALDPERARGPHGRTRAVTGVAGPGPDALCGVLAVAAVLLDRRTTKLYA